MNQPIIAFQGEPGAYSEEAAHQHFDPLVECLPCSSFDQVFQEVTQGRVTHGIVPIENSLAGSIHRNYDLMLRSDVHIVAEQYLRVSHCLLALPGVALKDIRRVHSHPQALAQCESNLFRLGVEAIPEADTAGSARQLRERQDRQAAVLASRQAAQVYGLEILAHGMEDNPLNYTRFLIIDRQPWQCPDPEAGDHKTSVVFSLQNQPGVLFKALSVFALRDIDLTKIESRPDPGKPWEYLFYVDFAGHAQSKVGRRALDHLAELAPFFRVLGSYPRQHNPPQVVKD